MRRNRTFYLVVLLHIVVLGIMVYILCRPMQEWNFEGPVTVSGEGGQGTEYISFHTDENGTYFLTQQRKLPVGSYEVKIWYEAASSGNTWNLYSLFPSAGMSAGNTAALLPTEEQRNIADFRTLAPIPDFAVKVGYGGEGRLNVSKIELRETGDFHNMVLFLGISLLIAVDLIGYMCKRKNSMLHRRDIQNEFFILACVVLIASAPLFTGYLVKGHDLRFHLTRILGIAKELQNGQFPVRMQSIWMDGFGYPVSVFYGDILLYLPALLKLTGFSLTEAYMIYVFGINCLTAVIAFKLGYKISQSRRAAILASAFYTLAPYRLILLYTRAALGEYTAYTFYPVLFYGIYVILTEDTQKEEYRSQWLYLTVGYTMLLQSHILSTEMASIFLGALCIFFIRRLLQRDRLLALLKAAAVTVFLNFGFLLPFLDYMRESYRFNTATAETLQMWGLTLSQLLMLFPDSRGYALAFRERTAYGEQLPAGIGFAALLVLAACIWYYINGEKKGGKDYKLLKLSFAGSIAALFMTTLYFPWDLLVRIPGVGRLLFGSIQYPSRFLGPAFFFMAVAVLCMTKLFEKEKQEGTLWVLLVAAGLLLSAGWFESGVLKDGELLSLRQVPLDGYDISNGEYLLEQADPSSGILKPETEEEKIRVEDWGKSGTQMWVSCKNGSGEAGTLQLPVYAYKYWYFKDARTRKMMEWTVGDNAQPKIAIPGNYHGTVLAEWKEPLLWRIAGGISLLTLLLIIMIRGLKRKNDGRIGEKK